MSDPSGSAVGMGSLQAMEPSQSAVIERTLRTGPVGLAFAVVLLVAEVSAALPPGPVHKAQLGASAVLLALTIVLARRRSDGTGLDDLAAPLLAIASSSLLMLSVGGLTTGLMALVVVPIAWAALYLRPWHSIAVVVASAVALWVISVIDLNPPSVIIRRVALWAAIGALVSVATHSLRARLESALRHREELLHQAEVLGEAARLLNQSHDPNEVVALAARLGALVASPSGHGPRRAHYLRIDGDLVRFVTGYDERGVSPSEPWPLDEVPIVARAVRTGMPVSGPIGENAGPAAKGILQRTGVTHGAWIPIHVGGELDGILAIASRGQAIPDELFRRGIELAQMVELALTNAVSMTNQKRLSRTDPVTGLANRRGFDVALRKLQEKSSFSILSMDLDGLKKVNDTYGHAFGDQLLVLVADALAGELRSDDVLGRLGGDEFAALLIGASPEEAETVAARMLSVLSNLRLGDVTPRISIGIAMADPGNDPDIVGFNADRAMYRAKRLGGMRYEFAQNSFPSLTGTSN